MLHLIPAPLHRRALRIAHRLRARWFRWRGGVVTGCSVIAQDGQGRVLLVRHSYGLGRWCFPGGGVRAGEDPVLAAQREFAEELGSALEDLVALGMIEESYHGAVNRVHVFTGVAVCPPMADGREIAEAAWFAPHKLPQTISSTVTRRLALLRELQQR